MIKGLETLKLLVDFIKEFDLGNVDKLFVDGSYDIIEEELKALEIIKRKKVDTYSFIENNYQNYDEYLNRMCILNCCNRDNLFEECWGILTQEEYDLLKETLL